MVLLVLSALGCVAGLLMFAAAGLRLFDGDRADQIVCWRELRRTRMTLAVVIVLALLSMVALGGGLWMEVRFNLDREKLGETRLLNWWFVFAVVTQGVGLVVFWISVREFARRGAMIAARLDAWRRVARFARVHAASKPVGVLSVLAVAAVIGAAWVRYDELILFFMLPASVGFFVGGAWLMAWALHGLDVVVARSVHGPTSIVMRE